jgi:hypothetical protein
MLLPPYAALLHHSKDLSSAVVVRFPPQQQDRPAAETMTKRLSKEVDTQLSNFLLPKQELVAMY